MPGPTGELTEIVRFLRLDEDDPELFDFIGRVGWVLHAGERYLTVIGIQTGAPRNHLFLLPSEVEPATQEDWEAQQCLDRLNGDL